MPGADRVVIGVEQHAVFGIEGLAPRLVRLEDERLEEPRRVGEVPLDGARIGHRLHHTVFGGEARGERDGGGAHLAETLRERAWPCRGRSRRDHPTVTSAGPATISPMTAARSKPSSRKIRSTSSQADGAHATSSPPLVCGSVSTARSGSPMPAPSFTRLPYPLQLRPEAPVAMPSRANSSADRKSTRLNSSH